MSDATTYAECIRDALTEQGQLGLSSLISSVVGADAPSVTRDAVESEVRRLFDAGELRRTPFGKYALMKPPPPADVDEDSEAWTKRLYREATVAEVGPTDAELKAIEAEESEESEESEGSTWTNDDDVSVHVPAELARAGSVGDSALTIDARVSQLAAARRDVSSQEQALVAAIDAERASLIQTADAYQGEIERAKAGLANVKERIHDLEALRRVVAGEAAAE